MVFTATGLLVGYVACQVLSAASNALSMTDRSVYGFLFRFTRLLTASLLPLEQQVFHIPSASPQEQEHTTTLNTNQ